jgi:hypothetical protein
MWSSPKVSGAYACVIHRNSKTQVLLHGAGGESDDSMQDYNPLWVSELRRTNAYEVWERVTDPLLFDIAEPR